MYVDDNLYCAPTHLIKIAIGASIKSNYIIFGEPDPSVRRDTISHKKFFATTCSPQRKQLGVVINSHHMTVSIPPDKRYAISSVIECFREWRQSFSTISQTTVLGPAIYSF